MQSTIQTSLTQKHLHPLPIVPLTPLPSPPPPHPSPLQGEPRAGASRLLSKMPETSPLVPFLPLNCSLTSTFLFLTPSLLPVFLFNSYKPYQHSLSHKYSVSACPPRLSDANAECSDMDQIVMLRASTCFAYYHFLFHNNFPRISNITDKHGIFRRNQTSAKFVKTEEPPSEDFRVQISL